MEKKKVRVVIGIDCAPCTPRPDCYIVDAVKFINKESYVTDNRLFGAWTWVFEDVDYNLYMESKEDLHNYFEDLYKSGKIRGAQLYYEDYEVENKDER